MSVKKYKVTCLNCKESDVHTIDELNHTVVYSDKILLTPMLGFRWRKDQQWGFRCICGNNNLICKEEKPDIDKLVAGDPESVKAIKKSINIPDHKQFIMELA